MNATIELKQQKKEWMNGITNEREAALAGTVLADEDAAVPETPSDRRARKASQGNMGDTGRQRKPKVRNIVFCENTDAVNLLSVRVVPHYNKNPNKDANGLWLVVDEKREILAGGTKKYCDDYVLNARQEYAEGHEAELEGKIKQLLSEAREKAKSCFGKNLASQQALVEDVHILTRKAITLASWVSEKYAGTIESIAWEIRASANLIYFGQKLWNIRIYLTEETALQKISNAFDVAIVDVGRKNGVPKFITHQVVLYNGEVIAEGSEVACERFVQISKKVAAERERAKKEKRAQAKWEAEKAKAQVRISEKLSEAKQRLRNGEQFIGDVQSLVKGAFDIASSYNLDSTPIVKFCDAAVMSLGAAA